MRFKVIVIGGIIAIAFSLNTSVVLAQRYGEAYIALLRKAKDEKSIKENFQEAEHSIIYLGEIKDTAAVSYMVFTDFIRIKTARGYRGKSKLLFLNENDELCPYIFDMPDDLPKGIIHNSLIYHVNNRVIPVLFTTLRSVICTPVECFNKD